MKVNLFAIFFLFVFNLNAQNWKSKVFNNKNQVEFGNTYTSYPNLNFGDNKNIVNKYLNYPNYRNHNYFIGYSRILNNNYTVSLDLISGFTPSSKNFSNLAIGEIIGSFYNLLNLGLGKQFNFLKLEFNPKIYLSYRYDGYQYTVFGYRNPDSWFSEPLFADLKYNSVGGSIGMDINYFITKHIGFGLKTSYNFYPFENAKLSAGSSTDHPDPFLVATHKPLNQMFILNFKLIARL